MDMDLIVWQMIVRRVSLMPAVKCSGRILGAILNFCREWLRRQEEIDRYPLSEPIF